jgi:hypothetical protein
MTSGERWGRAARFAAVAVLAGVVTLAGCAATPGTPTSTDAGVAGAGGHVGNGPGGFPGADASVDASQGHAGSTGTGGRTSAGAGGSSGVDAGTDAGVGCQVSLRVIAPLPPNPIEAGPAARLRVQGSVIGAMVLPPVWIWSATNDASSKLPTTATDSSGATIEIPIATPGAYQITAQLAAEPRCQRLLVVTVIPPQPASFVLRATAAGLPVQDTRISLSPGDPQPAVDFRLNPGIGASVSPQRADGNGGPLPSYVRVTAAASALSIEADTARGPLSTLLLPAVTYDVLVVPTEAYAPDLFSGTPATWRQPLQIDHGVHVTARTLATNGSPVVGARMLLSRGTLPSTLGTSDATGAMELWVRAGTLGAVVVPPPGSGLPRATVGIDGGGGIALDPSAGSLDLQMTWDAAATAPLVIGVRGPDGTTPIAGARVRVTSQAAAAPVGTLVARPAGGAGVSLRASGSTDVEVVSATAGVAAFPLLAIGGYDVIIIPPAAASPAAITSTSVLLVAGGLTRNVTLAGKVVLTGTVLPTSDSPGALVTAVDGSVTAAGAVTSTAVAPDGSYTLSVDPARSYQLLVDPATGVLRGRTVLTVLSTTTGTTVVSPIPLPVGHRVHGQVTADGVAVAGALIQVFCPTASPQCDPTFSLSDAISRGDGTFDLLLPEPSN